MKILITRYGQTDWNVLGKIQGQTDIELNDNGRQQAKETGELIKNENIDIIITSPLKRAKETAKIINENFNVTIIEDNRLMERNFGKSEGLTKDDRRKLKEINPEVNDVWNYNKNIDFNGMETVQDFCNRIYKFLDEIINKYRYKNILIVTHGGVSVPIKCYFMKYPLENLCDRDAVKGLKNCEITKFEIDCN